MKKLLVVLVGIFLFAVATTAFAETKVTVSLKAWSNDWEEEASYADGTSETFDIGSAIMVGPALNVRFDNNMFAGVTYLATTSDYEFQNSNIPPDTIGIDRKDLDLTVGYMFTPRFGMFIGYKNIDASARFTAPPPEVDAFDLTLKGPGIGILGNIPLTNSVALYGNLAFMSIKEKFEFPGGGSSSSDMTGASAEIGVAVAFSEAFSGNLGFKYQSFAGDKDEFGEEVTETFSGVTLGLNYTF
jgi:opacity protein-like surface antigen